MVNIKNLVFLAHGQMSLVVLYFSRPHDFMIDRFPTLLWFRKPNIAIMFDYATSKVWIRTRKLNFVVLHQSLDCFENFKNFALKEKPKKLNRKKTPSIGKGWQTRERIRPQRKILQLFSFLDSETILYFNHSLYFDVYLVTVL